MVANTGGGPGGGPGGRAEMICGEPPLCGEGTLGPAGPVGLPYATEEAEIKFYITVFLQL